MSLASGTRLGAYQISARIGVGGMGEVYKAIDTRLGRTVAIKVIREPNDDKRQRFQREARAISSLNNPLICGLYDVGQQDGIDYLVMEYLQGEPLSRRLQRGSLPLSDVLRIGAQIAAALDGAHREGLTHRDLKPANIMLTKTGIKLLDFGLSKRESPSGTGAAPGETVTMTEPGVIAGTPHYMAPEQLEGRTADTRSDIFAFGAVLYEMASGRPAFEAGSRAGVIAATLHADPAPLEPASLDSLVRLCLAKDPDQRWQSAADVGHALQWIEEVRPPEQRSRPSRRLERAIWAIASLALAAAAVIATIWLRQPLEPPALQTITYSGGDDYPAVSPDGKTLAFSSERGGKERIFLKNLSSGDEFPLTDGPDDAFPRFSPDGSTIAFQREGALYQVATLGGSPRKLVERVTSGADWSPDGTRLTYSVLDNDTNSKVYTAGRDGSSPRQITSEHRRVDSLRWSPDGRTIVGRISGLVSAAQAGALIVMASDGSSAKTIMTPPGGFFASAPAWIGPDEILYEQSLEVVGGTSVPAGGGRLVKQNIRSGKWSVLLQVPEAALSIDVGRSGIVFMDAMSPRQNLIELPFSEKPSMARSTMPGTAQDRQPVYSPDGNWILFASNRSGNFDLWKLSTKTGELRRLTDDPGHDWDPAFTPDGKSIVWSSNRSGNLEIWTADADGAGPRQVSHDGYEAENPNPTRDGWVYYVSGNPTHLGLWKVRMDGTGAERVVTGRLIYPDLSPDDQFLAFNRGMGTEVVRLADRKIFSADLDNPPASRTRWTADGRSLIFPDLVQLRKAGEAHGLLLQDFVAGKDLRATRRRLQSVDPSLDVETWAASPDGKKIVVSVQDYSSSIVRARRVPGLTR